MRAPNFVMVCGSGFTKMAAFDRSIALESLWHRRCGFDPAGELPKRGEKVMQMERATKLLKRVWKAVIVVELAVLAGVLIFVFSHYFSYSVFVSNFYQQANASTSVQRR
ncbi:MAG: hypothetical protein ACTHLX_17225 [Candidatus Binatia bacterium]